MVAKLALSLEEGDRWSSMGCCVLAYVPSAVQFHPLYSKSEC